MQLSLKYLHMILVYSVLVIGQGAPRVSARLEPGGTVFHFFVHFKLVSYATVTEHSTIS